MDSPIKSGNDRKEQLHDFSPAWQGFPMAKRTAKSIPSPMLKWDDPVSFVKGATASVRRAWSNLGIQTVGDLVLTLPRRYDDFSQVAAIGNTKPDQVYTVKGEVKQCRKLNTFRKRLKIIKLVIDDGTGTLTANFFNQPWLLEQIKPGMEVFLSGKVKLHRTYGRSMSHPILEKGESDKIAAGKISPVYGLSGTLAQKTYRRLMKYVFDHAEWPRDALPNELREKQHLPDFRTAASFVHEPRSSEEIEKGRTRYAFDELLGFHLLLNRARKKGEKSGAVSVPFDRNFAEHFVEHLPFELTGDQKRAAWAAFKNMEDKTPMRRLLQGDVGSGKTVVAAFLAASVIRAGQSAVFLAPTDILANQHYATIKRLLAPWNIRVLLITRTTKRAAFGEDEEGLENDAVTKLTEKGNVLLIGTHAILFKDRIPKDVALSVIDEQQRFGVGQREAVLSESRFDGKIPHLLSMTATPIPRSLALTLYGDLDISLIREKPKNRQKIETRLLVGKQRSVAYKAIIASKSRGERAFIVCPLIDPSDALGVRSVEDEYKRLRKTELKDLKLGMLHGRMKSQEKEQVMRDLKDGKLDAVISTTVIEVGIDIPDATVIVIDGADRFGLAQLHQLRGRVGRSDKKSYCFLLSDASDEALERLRLLQRHDDGFRLAEEDMKLRGAGKILGLSQSGMGDFQAVRLTDVLLMKQAKHAAEEIETKNPDFDPSSLPAFRMSESMTEHLE